MSEPILFNGVATIRAAQAGAKVPTFSITPAYNGGPLFTSRYPQGIIVDLSGLTVNDQAITATINHDDERLVGHVASVKNDGRSVSLAGIISAAGAAADELIESSKRGFPWHASVEARPLETPEYIGEGEAVTVNGQTFSGPVLVARRAELYGVSFVARGADEKTNVAIAAQQKKQGVRAMEKITFEKWCEAIGVTADDWAGNPDLETRLRAKYDEAVGVTDTQQNEEQAQVTASEMRELRAEIKAAEARRELDVLRASRPLGPSIMASAGNLGHEAYECALMRHIGQRRLSERIYAEQTLDAADKIHASHVLDIFRGLIDFRGSRDDLIKAAFGGPSTADIPNLLSAVANKTLLDQYNSFPSAARMVATVLAANDFKTHLGLRLTGDATFKQLPGAGEIKHASLGEQTFTYKVDTFARMCNIDRRDIINDDLGSFAQLPTILGRGAAVAVEQAFWTLVLSNPGSFFHDDNANLIDDVLDSAGLGVGVEKLLKMVDANGDPVNAIPRFLVVPPELKKAADELFRSTTVNTGGGSAATQVPSANSFFGLYQPVVSPYLSNANYAGNSATGWFLFCDPSNIPAFALSYLQGQEAPTVEQVELPANQLGICFRGFLDFGVAAMDSRGAVKSSGDAGA
jgi:hypothetical protein